MTLLWCVGAVPHALHCLDLKPGKPPERQEPPGSTVPPEVAAPPVLPKTVAPTATAITEGPPTGRPKPAADTAHERQISKAIPRGERPIARQARPEPAEGDAREDRQGGAEGGAAADTTVRRSGRARKPKQRS